mmetsp:Transcript_59838/g.106726  ORF Transcript_59838/g.106726 Transcript_59838/m.106726 type:complete len:218 (-) Transcript_59838:127-780(-)
MTAAAFITNLFCCSCKTNEIMPMKMRAIDGSVPDRKEFTLTIDKASDRGLLLGLDVDTIDGPTLLVNDVHSGLISRWNERNVGMQVRKGDRFTEVNGVKGDGAKLIKALTVNQFLEIRVRRPELFQMTLRRNMDTSLGLDLSYVIGGATLLVKGVNLGLVNDWNLASQGFKVEKHDRVLEVNGLSGAPQELSEMLAKPGLLEITFMKGLQSTDPEMP